MASLSIECTAMGWRTRGLSVSPRLAWFDQSKEHFADFRHRALRHHTQGIFECERTFGPTIELSTCKRCGTGMMSMLHDDSDPVVGSHEFEPKLVPTRIIGEQHVQEDLGFIPSLGDWLTTIQPEPWMNRSRRLSKELDELSQKEIDDIGDATGVHL